MHFSSKTVAECGISTPSRITFEELLQEVQYAQSAIYSNMAAQFQLLFFTSKQFLMFFVGFQIDAYSWVLMGLGDSLREGPCHTLIPVALTVFQQMKVDNRLK